MKYNSDINSIGGIPDYHIIYESLRIELNDDQALKKKFIDDNIFGIRTEEGRGRFYRGIKSSILCFNNENHKDLFYSFFKELNYELPYNLLIFWQMVINNKLFQILTEELYLKFYYQGKTTITGEDVYYFIMDLKERDQSFRELNWTKKTIQPIATKYLTLLRKLDLVEGVQKKELIHIQISDLEFSVFLYLLSSLYPQGDNFINNYLIKYCFISNERFIERVKKVAQKGLIKMSYTGSSLTIEPILEYKNVAHGLFGRS